MDLVSLPILNKIAKGFTLIEIMIVLVILAVLSALGIMAFTRVIMQARDAKRQTVMNDLRQALGRYNLINQQYPNSPNDFCGTIYTLVSGNFLDLQPLDPASGQPICVSGNDGNKTIGRVMYNYIATPSSGTASSYQLKLVKETGGYSDFYSGQ